MTTLRKDYFGSIQGDDLILSSNPNNPTLVFEEMEDLTRRYLFKEGDKIVTPFGIQTIKEIDRNHSPHRGYEWLIFVEENRNQYKPCEIIGIYIKTIKL